jgi:hypothetical protein
MGEMRRERPFWSNAIHRRGPLLSAISRRQPGGLRLVEAGPLPICVDG